MQNILKNIEKKYATFKIADKLEPRNWIIVFPEPR